MARAQLSPEIVTAMRQKLLALALDIYRAEGLEAISFRRLADAAGISHTLPYRYFENKDALLAQMRCAAVRRFEAFIRARERPGEPALERVRSVYRGYIEYARHNAAEYLLIFASHQAPPDHYPELLGARRSLFEHAATVAHACMPAGTSVAQARVVAHTFWIGLHGLMTLHGANQLVHGCTLDQLADALFEVLLASLRPAAPLLPVSRARTRAPARTKGERR